MAKSTEFKTGVSDQHSVGSSPGLDVACGLAVKSTGLKTLVFLFSRVWVRVPAMTLVTLSKTL